MFLTLFGPKLLILLVMLQIGYILIGRKPNISYFWVFGCKCYILKKVSRLSKFEKKCDDGFFLGYSSNSKAYRVYNKTHGIVEEVYDVEFDETNGSKEESDNLNDVRGEELIKAMNAMAIGDVKPKEVEDDDTIMPNRVDEALQDPELMNAMHEELNNFTQNEELVERPKNYNVIGTKWVFHNKHDEKSIVVRNKARLVAQGYIQVEGLDFGETFSPVARLEAIRILLVFACAHNIKLFQMDCFLNGKISELVYVEQPPSFEDPKKPDQVYKLSKALYGLKQAPQAWYERLRDFLVSKGFKIGKVDTTLFTKLIGNDLFICQIYVDDIIFGSTNASFCEEFGEMMSKEFEMSMIGELCFFLGLQIMQLKDGIFVSQSKYSKDMLKKFGLEDAKPSKTPMGRNGLFELDKEGKLVDQKLYRSMIGSLLYITASRPMLCLCLPMCSVSSLTKRSSFDGHKKNFEYPKGDQFELIGYSDSYYVECKVDRKSTSGSCQFLGWSLVSWSSKKQNSVFLSTTEAEYIAAGSCCAQLLWMKQTLLDYGDNFNKVPLIDHVGKGDISICAIGTEDQLADIFTKLLDEEKFCKLRNELNFYATAEVNMQNVGVMYPRVPHVDDL
ncbi:LOW QUALITY PROTEIN: hypothetical protein U9M48_040076 [Paspalum notatum var. saurae]|uniref:Reverse transcriptase Ty1/copia-type domain-containing protein n=1 Tax=Paspalum notatum var. saurae TaxID=547442 RepID=A0AAQ3UPQ3_PASNO